MTNDIVYFSVSLCLSLTLVVWCVRIMCFCFKYFINLSGHLTLVRLQKPQEAGLPIPATVCSILLCIYAMAWLPVFAALCCVSLYTVVWLSVIGIVNVHADVAACDCTRGLYGHRKSLHRKLTVGDKSLAAPGIRTRVNIALGRSTNWAIYSPPHSCNPSSSKRMRDCFQ